MKSRYSVFVWGALLMLLAIALTLAIAPRQQAYLEEQQIAPPEVTLGPVLVYFFGAVVVMALILFIIPVRWLRMVFRLIFALVYGWGFFIVFALMLGSLVGIAVALVAGILWVWHPQVWSQDLLLLVALAAAGSVFGSLFSPLTFIIFMLVIAAYDVLAVLFGFMVWMADRLSQMGSLPAFILPKNPRHWLAGLGGAQVGRLLEKDVSGREFAILGGGDVGFPLLLVGSVYFESGLEGGLVVGFMALLGLMGAFLMQMAWFKDRPVPALPPIALFSLAGLFLSRLWF